MAGIIGFFSPGCRSDSLGFSTTADGLTFMAEVHMKCDFCLFSPPPPISGKSTDFLAATWEEFVILLLKGEKERDAFDII